MGRGQGAVMRATPFRIGRDTRAFPPHCSPYVDLSKNTIAAYVCAIAVKQTLSQNEKSVI